MHKPSFYCTKKRIIILLPATSPIPLLMKYNKKGFSEERLLHLYNSILKPRMIEEKMLILLRQGKYQSGFQVSVKKPFL